MTDFKAIFRLAPILSNYRRAFIKVISSSFLGAIFEGVSLALLVPFLFSIESGNIQLELESETWFVETLNLFASKIPFELTPIHLVVIIILLIVLKSITGFLHEYIYSRAYAEFAEDLRTLAFRKALYTELSYIEQKGTGKLVNTISEQTWSVTDTAFSFAGLIFHGFSILILTTLLLLLSWQMTLIVFAIATLISLITRYFTKQIASLSKKAVELEQEITSTTIRGIQGIRIVKMFNQEFYEQTEFKITSEKIKHTFFKLDILESMIRPTSEILAMVLVSAALLWLLRDINQLPLIVTLVLVIYRLHPQIIMWDQARSEILAGSGAVHTVADLLEANEQKDYRAMLKPFEGLKKRIEFSDVSFRYSKGTDEVIYALKNISLVINKNQTTAIVGRSGSGKTTIVNLLLRFYSPSSGEILVDGEPLSQLALADWRKKLAVVSQDVVLFNGTIAENIAYGNPSADLSHIKQAAKYADADQFIRELPHGYNTVIGDRGSRLSGGQKQRISFARAILMEPEILILDEATNALDSISEAQVYEYIHAIGGQRTVLIISHNLSRIENADQIYVLEEGEVKEAGMKAELLSNEGLFSELYNLQSSQFNEFEVVNSLKTNF